MSGKRPCSVLAALLIGVAQPAASAQPAKGKTALDYPTKAIRLVVSLTAGGPTDILARIIAQPLSESLGQPVIVDNRPGAAGNIGAEMVARAPADGYTLLIGSSGPLSINVSLYSKLPFDPVKDFAPIILVASAPFVIAVNPTVPANSIDELIALAKAKPDQLNYGSVPGSASHLATELFKSLAGIRIVQIPYKGAAPATSDLIAGQIQLSFASTPGVMPLVKVGKLKALAVTSPKRLAKLPDVPTVAESGLAGYDASVWYGVVAPAKTPREVIVKLNAEIGKIIQQHAVRQRMLSNDFEPISTTPEQFGVFIKSEIDKWGEVVKTSGARAD